MSGRSIADISNMTVQDILEHPVSGTPDRTPREQFELPNTDLPKEPRALWDASGSNLESADPEQTITKMELVASAMPILAKAMQGDDAEISREQSGGSYAKGGLLSCAYSYDRPFFFKPGDDEPEEDERWFGDINEANALEMADRYRALVKQRQMTYVAPALNATRTAFKVEFPDGGRCCMDICLGDGKFDDPDAFDAYIKSANPEHCIAVGAIGFGNAHDHFVEHLAEVSAKNQYFTYAALTGSSDPLGLALDLRLLSGTAKMQ